MKFKFLLCASAALLPAVPAFAQDRDDDEVVVVATGVEQAANETGRSVTIIDRAEIERRQTVILSDLLATTAGLSVTRNGGIGGLTALRIRGAEGEQTLVLIDGVRVNDPSSPGGAFDFGNLAAGAVDHVEVLRGPNSVAWGSQAIGGVVNVVTERPTNGFIARGNVEYGDANQVSANASLSGGNDSVSGGITGGYISTDGISQAAVGKELDGYRQYNGSARLKVEFAPGFGADLRGYFADSKLDIDGFPAPFYSFADTAEYSIAQELYGYAGLHADIGPVKSRVSLSIADINRDGFDPAFSAKPAYIYRGRSERYAYQGDATPIEQLRLAFGAERENSRFYDGARTQRAGITSFYGEAIVTPVEAVTLTGGIRSDNHSSFGNHTSFGVSGAVRPMRGTVLRASYGESFKAPTLYQLFAPFYGTKTLKPETAKSWDVGAEQSFLDDKVKISATWFNRDTRNQIDFDLATFTYANLARTRAQGVELELKLRPVSALIVSANYTYTDAENRSAGLVGKDLQRRPRDTASFLADWITPIKLSVGGTITIVGDSFNNASNTARLDGFAVAGVRAEMPIGERFAIYGRVDNVTDAKYQVVSGYSSYGRAAYAGVRLRFD